MAEETKSPYLIPIAVIVAGGLVGAGIYFGGKSPASPPTQQVAAPQDQQGEVAGEEVIADVSVDNDASKGSADAPVTIVEFSEYQCPFCKRFVDETYGKIFEEYGDQIHYVFRDYPLPFHPNAQKASEAAECAGDQGKYFEYHDLLFENQEEWSEENDAPVFFKKYAADLNLNTTGFDSCLDEGQFEEEVKKDFADGEAAGVQGTPSFFINGRLLVGAQPFEAFQQIIDEELAK